MTAKKEQAKPKKPTTKKPAAAKMPSGFWAKKIYIKGHGVVQGEATTEQKKAFLNGGTMEGLEARLVDEDPVAKIKEEQELKRKARLGLK